MPDDSTNNLMTAADSTDDRTSNSSTDESTTFSTVRINGALMGITPT